MGEEGGDPQKIKKIAAAAFEYERDPRWAEYWSNILIPPHMASRSDVVDHFKRKFYHRFIEHVHDVECRQPLVNHFLLANKFSAQLKDPDFVVETMSSSSSSQPARASASSSSPPVSEHARPQNQGPSSGTSASPGRNPSSLPFDRRTIHFSVNAWVLVVAVLGMLPVVPRTLSNKAYRLSLLGTTCSSFYSLYTLYGIPRAWNLPSIQSWFQSIIATKDFIHFLYCLMFFSSQLHLKFALIPVFCWSLEHVVKFLRRNFTRSSLYRKYLERPCLWVEGNTATLGILSSNAEISLGFLLIFALLSWQRNILQTFMYWQLLKVMYHAPVTAGYHQGVWARIDRTVTPYIHRYAPFLNMPISAVQRWWFR